LRPPTDEEPCTFIVEHKTDKKRCYSLKAITKEEAEHWIHALATQLKPRSGIKQHVFFGRKLEDLKTNSDGIPLVLEKIINFLSQKGLKVEGIFRLSGSVERVEEICQSLDKAQETFNFREESELEIHAVASVLKAFLRELPEPLFTFDLYQSFLAASNVESMISLIQSLPEKKQKGVEVFISLHTCGV